MDSDTIEAAQEYERAGDLYAAIAEYRRLAAIRPDVRPLIAQGELHSALGELIPAVETFATAETRQPANGEVKLRLAHVLTSMGRDIAAIRSLQAGIRDNPSYAELRVNLADICKRFGWFDVGYWAVRPLPSALPDWWARARVESVREFEHLRKTTLNLLKRRRIEGDLDHGARWELANNLFGLGRLRTALALCRQLMKATPDAFPPHDLASRIIARQQGPSAALAYLKRLPPSFQIQPAFVDRSIRCYNELSDYLGLLQLARGRPDLAASFDISFCTAVALLWQQDTGALRKHCRTWMQRSPAEVLPAGVILSLEGSTSAIPPAQTEPPLLELVQFWDKPDVPQDVQRVFDSWSEFHPKLRRLLFDERTARDFIREEIGLEALHTFDLCHHAAMKADYFRMAYIYIRGGLYIDADERCLRNMDALLHAVSTAQIAAVRSGEPFGYLHNYFLGGQVGSRPMEIALTGATQAIEDAAREGRRPSIWETTGPGLITRAVGYFIAESEKKTRADNAIFLLPLLQYRSFVTNASDLDYKRQPDANWQLI